MLLKQQLLESSSPLNNCLRLMDVLRSGNPPFVMSHRAHILAKTS